ncbi:hypothetical protein BGW39_008065 [Mortierella sp. 14UC]|nr:hypothetical protein BGW39_008065 [Mortierella sp. 14UC]
MANKYIDSKDVIRTQDGKIDLFQTILARKDPDAQIPVVSDPQPVTTAGRANPINSNNTPSTYATEPSSSSSGSSQSWRATHVAPGTTTTSASARNTPSPYATYKDLSASQAKSAPKKTLWSAVFVGYCNDPQTIPDNVRYWHDDDHVIIKDAYPKAKVHMLVMPRTPVDKVTELVGEAGIRTVEGLVRVAATLLTTLKAENPYLEFKMGFHIVPSMSHLHLHVISQDFCSPCLKKALHWNSFNTGFFIPPDEVIRVIREKGSFEKTAQELSKYGSLKKVAMMCNQCPQELRTIPMLTHHMNEHYVQKVKALQKQERLTAEQGPR